MAHLDLPTEPLPHPLLGMYQNQIQILGDIIEPIFDKKEWQNTDNEWNNYAQPKHRLTINRHTKRL